MSDFLKRFDFLFTDLDWPESYDEYVSTHFRVAIIERKTGEILDCEFLSVFDRFELRNAAKKLWDEFVEVAE